MDRQSTENAGWIHRLLRRLRNHIPRLRRHSGEDNVRDRRLQREIEAELTFHLEMRTREYVAAGMEPDEARRRAMRRMGELDEVRRAARRARRGGRGNRRVGRALDGLLLDLRFAVRSMGAAPGPTAVALLALALGIGATTAIFSVVDGVLLKELPYEDPDRIITIVSEALLLDGRNADLYEQRIESVDRLGLFTRDAHELTGVDAPRRVSSMPVTEGFFPILGVPAARGRTLVASDHDSEAPAAAVISDRLWRTTLGADPDIVGQSIVLDGQAFVVAGVMPPSFTFYRHETTDVWVPMAHVPLYGGFAIARLSEGATLERARIEVEALDRQLGVEPLPRELPVQTLHDMFVESSRPALMLLAGAVGLVLLIACANVANLLLARSLVRRGEIAVRSALGASRGRVVRQLLTESALLASAGGALGVGLAWWSVPVLVSLVPSYVPRAENVAVDLRVLSFALAASLATGLLFGLAPAVVTRRGTAGAAIAGGDGRASDSRAARRMLDGLVVIEVALALVLVAGTGLLVRTFLTLRPSAPGFDPRGKLTFELRPPESRYPDPAALAGLYERTLEELRTLPGAAAAAAVTVPPFVRILYAADAIPEGRGAGAEPLRISYQRASTDYFDVMGIPLLRGGSFAESDGDPAAGGATAAVVNQDVARRLWPEENPLGKPLRLKFFTGERDYIVVGVAADVRSDAARTGPFPTVWAPFRADPSDRMSFVVQARERPEGLIPAVRDLIRRLDAELPVDRVRTMEEILYESVGSHRFYTTLMSAFGGIALLLAAIGFYGVMSYTVSRRTRELGVRLALGASPATLLAMVLRKGLATLVLGVAIGLGGAIAFTRLLEARIYGMQPAGLLMLPALIVLVVAVGMAASYVPARRATRVDPLTALRSQ
jgi:predicted permease